MHAKERINRVHKVQVLFDKSGDYKHCAPEHTMCKMEHKGTLVLAFWKNIHGGGRRLEDHMVLQTYLANVFWSC